MNQCYYCRYQHYKLAKVKLHETTCEQRLAMIALGHSPKEGRQMRPIVGAPAAQIDNTESRATSPTGSSGGSSSSSGRTVIHVSAKPASKSESPSTKKAGKPLSLSGIAATLLPDSKPLPSEAELRQRDTDACCEHIRLQRDNIRLARQTMVELEQELYRAPSLPQCEMVTHETRAVALIMSRKPKEPQHYRSLTVALDGVPPAGDYILYEHDVRTSEVLVEPHYRNIAEPGAILDIHKNSAGFNCIGVIFSCVGPWVLRSRIRLSSRPRAGRYSLQHRFKDDLHFCVTVMDTEGWSSK